ncbi:MAG: hypothetical protein QOH90_1498, partial [Actinomycetota bacterium]|nr:hypothetical protein [Actinomycetota bacterium]
TRKAVLKLVRDNDGHPALEAARVNRPKQRAKGSG